MTDVTMEGGVKKKEETEEERNKRRAKREEMKAERARRATLEFYNGLGQGVTKMLESSGVGSGDSQSTTQESQVEGGKGLKGGGEGTRGVRRKKKREIEEEDAGDADVEGESNGKDNVDKAGEKETEGVENEIDDGHEAEDEAESFRALRRDSIVAEDEWIKKGKRLTTLLGSPDYFEEERRVASEDDLRERSPRNEDGHTTEDEDDGKLKRKPSGLSTTTTVNTKKGATNSSEDQKPEENVAAHDAKGEGEGEVGELALKSDRITDSDEWILKKRFTQTLYAPQLDTVTQPIIPPLDIPHASSSSSFETKERKKKKKEEKKKEKDVLARGPQFVRTRSISVDAAAGETKLALVDSLQPTESKHHRRSSHGSKSPSKDRKSKSITEDEKEGGEEKDKGKKGSRNGSEEDKDKKKATPRGDQTDGKKQGKGTPRQTTEKSPFYDEDVGFIVIPPPSPRNNDRSAESTESNQNHQPQGNENGQETEKEKEKEKGKEKGKGGTQKFYENLRQGVSKTPVHSIFVENDKEKEQAQQQQHQHHHNHPKGSLLLLQKRHEHALNEKRRSRSFSDLSVLLSGMKFRKKKGATASDESYLRAEHEKGQKERKGKEKGKEKEKPEQTKELPGTEKLRRRGETEMMLSSSTDKMPKSMRRSTSFSDLKKMAENLNMNFEDLQGDIKTQEGKTTTNFLGSTKDGVEGIKMQLDGEQIHVTQGPIFGITLEQAMSMQSASKMTIPFILHFLTDAVLQLGGRSQEGLFRVPGNKVQMEAVKEQLNQGNYVLDPMTNPHIVASLLKEWLGTLAEPLVPIKLYHRCLATVAKPRDSVAIVEELPQLNRRVLKFIVTWLQDNILQPEVQRKTRMDISSIAMAFGPCFLSYPEQRVEEMVKNIQGQNKFTVNLLMLMNSEVQLFESKVIHLRSNELSNKRSISVVNDKFRKWQDKSKKKSLAAHNIREQQKQRLAEVTKEEMHERKKRTFDQEDLLKELAKEKEKEKDKKRNFLTLPSPKDKDAAKDL